MDKPFRLIALLALLPAGGAPQDPPPAKDPPKVTYEDSGDFRLLVMDLERRFKGRVRFAEGIESKEVSISVRDAGYFEALDALCRAHKGVRYFDLEGVHRSLNEAVVGPGAWFDHPSSYHGHFKTALASMLRVAHRAPDGAGARVDVDLVLHAPPWIPISDSSGTEVEWKIEEARDADDRDVLSGLEARYAGDRITVAPYGKAGTNTAHFRIALRDFDSGRGLRVLAGKALARVADVRIERIEVEEGRSFEIGGGTLSVDRVSEDRDHRDEKVWKIGVAFKPKAESADPKGKPRPPFEGRARHEGGKGEWVDFEIRYGGPSYSLRTLPLDKAPAWIELRLRGEERVIEIPFSIKNAVFKKE